MSTLHLPRPHRYPGVALFWAAVLTASTVAQDPSAGERDIAPVAASQPAAASRGAALDDDIGLLDLEIPVVVTATRREQKAALLPYAVSVITADDIRRSGVRSVADALRLVPGVDVGDINAAVPAVSPRGFHAFYANKTLVLVDGRQVYDGESGGTLWGSWPFMLEDIERIEVIRGPGGVTWGANAVNGVINIITKDPRTQQGLTLSGEGGSRGAHRAYTGYAFTDAGLRMRVSAEYEGNDGLVHGGSPLRSLDDNFKTARGGLYGILDAGPNDRLTFSGGSAVMDGGFTPSFFAAQRRQNPGTQGSFLNLRWDRKLPDDNALNVSGYVNDFAFDQGTKSTDTRYQQYGVALAATFKPSSAHTLSLGIDGRADAFDASNADPGFLAERSFIGNGLIGVYAQDEWRFAPRWALSVGGRIDYDFYGGFQPSARGSLAYQLDGNSLVWGAISRAYQMSTAPLRYLDTPVFGGIGRVGTDRELRPVELLAYELGYRTRVFERLDLNADVFWHEYASNYGLATRLGPPGLFQLRTEEVGDSSLYGFEMEARYRVTDTLKLLGHYTFQNLDWRSATEFTGSQDTTVPPRNKFMVGAQWDPVKDLHLSGHLYWVDSTLTPNADFQPLPRHVDSYFRLDLRAEYEFWEKRAALAVGVRNLTDPSHFETGSVAFVPGEAPRTIYAQLRLTFK